MAGWTAGIPHLVRGEWAQARSWLEVGIAALRNADAVLALPWAIATAAWVLSELDEESEALIRLREGEQLMAGLASRDLARAALPAYHALGRTCLRLGRVDDARRFGEVAVQVSSRHPGAAAHALHLLGDAAIHPDHFDAERGADHYRRALALAEPRGMRPLVAHCHLGLGKLHAYTNEPDRSREHLSVAGTMYGEMEMAFWLEQARYFAVARSASNVPGKYDAL
jgi:hypothetical protein